MPVMVCIKQQRGEIRVWEQRCELLLLVAFSEVLVTGCSAPPVVEEELSEGVELFKATAKTKFDPF